MVVLLGDSVFDNGSYVEEGEADVLTHLRKELRPHNQDAVLLARDGAVSSDVVEQMSHLISHKPSHLVISAGGNDALHVRYAIGELFNSPLSATSQAETTNLALGNVTNLLGSLLEIRSRFQTDYSHLLKAAKETKLPGDCLYALRQVPGRRRVRANASFHIQRHCCGRGFYLGNPNHRSPCSLH